MNEENMAYLESKLNAIRPIVLKKHRYYEQKQTVRDFGISTPPKLRREQTAMGWATKSVDILADRISLEGFRNDTADLEGLFKYNNKNILTGAAMLEAIISGCSFVYVRKDENKQVKMQVIDASRATGEIDESTGLLDAGYAILEVDKKGKPITKAYFEKEQTTIKGPEGIEVIKNNAGQCLLIPILYRPDSKQVFGRSRISRSSMDYINAAMRTLKRAEISSEFYSFPQKYATGLSDDAEMVDSWAAAMSALITFTKDEDGDKPTIGQFNQQSMAPHIDHIRALASLFAGETGLTLQDLGFENGNPASFDAIKAAHETLRAMGRKAQACFEQGFLNVGYVAKCLQDEKKYNFDVISDTKLIWKPLFEPDTGALSGIGDFLIKLNQVNPEYIDDIMLAELLGF